jgi:hypothetical protein
MTISGNTPISHIKALPIEKKGRGKLKEMGRGERGSYGLKPAPLAPFSVSREGSVVKLTLPIPLPSIANISEHWSKRAARKKIQASWVRIGLQNAGLALTSELCQFPGPYKVTFCRHSPRLLDAHDNLRMAFKGLVDTVASYLVPGLAPGRADSYDKFYFYYDQQKDKAKYVTIKIESIPLEIECSSSEVQD